MKLLPFEKLGRVLRRPGWAWVATIAVPIYFLTWDQAPLVANDSESYFRVARDLVDEAPYGVHIRPPGYPLLLVLTGSTEGPTRLLLFAELGLYFAAVLAFAALLEGLGAGPLARAGFVLIAALPPWVEPAAKVLTENLSLVILAVVFLFLARWFAERRNLDLALAALACGALPLVKPTFQVLGIVLALFLLLEGTACTGGDQSWRRSLQRAAAFALLSLLPLVAFSSFNYRRHGFFGLSPGNLPYSISTKTVRVLERLPDAFAAEREAMILVRDRALIERGSSHTAEQYHPLARSAVAEVTGLRGDELDRHLLRLHLTLISLAPLSFVSEVLVSVTRFWMPTASSLSIGGSRIWQGAWSLLHFAVIGLFTLQLTVVFGALLVGAARRCRGAGNALGLSSGRAELTLYLLAITIVAYNLLISCVVHHGEARFRTPTDLLILFLLVVGGAIWWRTSGPSQAEGTVTA